MRPREGLRSPGRSARPVVVSPAALVPAAGHSGAVLVRELSPAERAALEQALAAQAAGDERGAEAAWFALVVASGRRPVRFRWVVGRPLNGHDRFAEDK